MTSVFIRFWWARTRAFCSEEGSFPYSDSFFWKIVVGILDKSTALCKDPVQGSIAHKEASFGFLFFKFQDAPKVWADGGEKSEIVGDITFFIKGIFRQKHRKLSLNTKTWTKGFLKQIIVTQ